MVSRDKEGALHVFVNSCAHRGVMVCRKSRGNRKPHTCIYHQWSCDLQGNLLGVPFRKGINQRGGYEADFDRSKHSLQKLQAAIYNSLLFASFASDIAPLEEYIGPGWTAFLNARFRFLVMRANSSTPTRTCTQRR